MALAAIAADLDQALDVHIHFASEIALDADVAVYELAQAADLIFGEVLDTGVGADPRGGEHLPGGGGPDAIDVGQRDLDALLAGDIYPSDSGHAPGPPRVTLLGAALGSCQAPRPSDGAGRCRSPAHALALALLMLGILAADHHHHPLATADFAVLAAWLNRRSHLHYNTPLLTEGIPASRILHRDTHAFGRTPGPDAAQTRTNMPTYRPTYISGPPPPPPPPP